MIQIASRPITNHRYKSIKDYTEKLYIKEDATIRNNGLYYVVDCIIETKEEFSNGKISNKMVRVERQNYCLDLREWSIYDTSILWPLI